MATNEYRTDSEARKRIAPSQPIAFGVRTDGVLYGITVQFRNGAPFALPKYPAKVIFFDGEKLGSVEYIDHAEVVEGAQASLPVKKVASADVYNALNVLLAEGGQMIDSNDFNVQGS